MSLLKMTDKNTIFFKYTPTSCVQMCYERQSIVVINKHDGNIIVKMYINIHFLVSIFVVLDEFLVVYYILNQLQKTSIVIFTMCY